MIPMLVNLLASLHRINFIMWDQELKSLSDAVSKAIDISKEQQKFSTSKDSNSTVGVYIIAYGEIIPILLQAPSHKGLDTVRWYGSDGITKNERLLEYHNIMNLLVKRNLLLL